jgi:dihydrofolate reductase
MEVVLVAALADNGVIGADGALPWHLPDDLKRFKALTLGKPIVMGRKTYASIGRPLPKRRNVVLSRSTHVIEGVEAVHGVDEALALLEGEAEIAIIGGEQIYRAFLPYATKLELTHVETSVEGDARFPAIDADARAAMLTARAVLDGGAD